VTEATPGPFSVTTADFDARVLEASRGRPVLVDFWAAWCAPCKMVAPVLERLATEYAHCLDIAKVDADAEPALAARYGVRSLPTLAMFHGGKLVDAILGAQPEGVLRTLIERHVERPVDRERQAARDRAASGDVDGALLTLKRLAAAEPDRPQHFLALVDILLDAGRLDEAADAIAHVPLVLQGDAGLALRRSRLAIGLAGADPAQAEAGGAAAANAIAARAFAAGRHAEAIEAWLGVMGSHPGDGRRTVPALLKAAFNLLGEEHELVATSRRRLASMMH
jgi:putative thioredoxin